MWNGMSFIEKAEIEDFGYPERVSMGISWPRNLTK